MQTMYDTPSSSPAVPAKSSRNWGVASHLSSFVVFLGVPLPVLGPLVVWLMKKDDGDEFAARHATEALNFNISMTIYALASAILIIALVGVLLLPAVAIAWFVLTIVAAVRASNGEPYRYPMSMRFVD